MDNEMVLREFGTGPRTTRTEELSDLLPVGERFGTRPTL